MSDAIRKFLARVLPWNQTGVTAYYNIHWTNAGKRWRGRACRDLDEAVEHVVYLKKQADVRDIYCCMSSQRIAELKQTASGYSYYWAERSVAGAVEIKSLWVDVDVKASSYASTRDAVEALQKFCKDAGLPVPTLIVATGGGGFHAHWVLDRALKPDEWKPLALALVEAAKQHGFQIDPGVTVDASRILRIPDTTNHKYTPVRPVRLGSHNVPIDYPVEYIAGKLLPYMTMQRTQPSPGVTGGASIHKLANDELSGGIGSGPSFSFADFRSAVEALDATGHYGDGQYENIRNLGFACASITHDHPADAAAARELYDEVVANNGRDPLENDKRYNDAVGGTTSKTASGDNLIGPGTIFKQAQGKGWTPPPPPPPGTSQPDLPPGYTRQADGTVWFTKTDSAGLSRNVSVSSFPIHNGWISPDPLTLNFVTKIMGRDKIISIAHEKAARKEHVGPTLTGQGFVTRPVQAIDMQEFLLSWITHLQSTRRVSSAHAFGWTGGGFAYAGVIHSPSGIDQAGGADPNTLRIYDPCGDLQPWLDAARIITDQKRPALNAILASAFAGPLVKLIGQDGLLVSAYSSESGIGKTTALRVAQAVWGHPIEAAQGLTDTYNSVVGKLGDTRNLPLYWDEIKSEEHVEKFVALAFQLSSGREKSRMTQTSSQRKSGTWSTLLMSCSNDSIVESIASASKSSNSGVYRCFEFRVPKATGPSPLSMPTVTTMVAKLKDHYGRAGEIYAKFLGSNEASIQKNVQSLNEKLVVATFATAEERFWVASIAALMVGAHLANQLGLTQIDVKAMRDFLIAELGKSRMSFSLQATTVSFTANVSDVLSQFMRDMRVRNTLFTDIIWNRPGKPRAGSVNLKKSDGNLTELKVQIGVDDRLMRVGQADLGAWLHSKKFSQQTYYEEFRKQFGMKSTTGSLGAGTDHSTGTMRILEFDLSSPLMQGYFATI